MNEIGTTHIRSLQICGEHVHFAEIGYVEISF